MTFQGVDVYMVKPLDTSAIFKIFKEIWTWKPLEISEILPRRSKSVLPQKPKQVRSNPENPFARLEKHPSSCNVFLITVGISCSKPLCLKHHLCQL